MERKINLNVIPKKGKYIDWKKSIGCKIDFVYDDIVGDVIVKDYDPKTKYIVVEYKNQLHNIRKENLAMCHLGKILGKVDKSFKLNIGQILVDEKKNITIINREHKKRLTRDKYIIEKWYMYHCNICSYEEWIVERNIVNKKHGCKCCANKVAVLGINTIWDTDRWMCDLGISEEDAKKYTKCSNQKITVKCPECENIKKIGISTIYVNKSIRCFCNSSGVSYSERFMLCLLKQLREDYVFQLSRSTFDWCGNYRYDFYLPNANTIIEMNGKQHYFDIWEDLNITKENDLNKLNTAQKNNIDKYVIIDCRNSELTWIKNNVLKSDLNNIFDLSKINWKECEEFALGNLVKKVCEYWNNKQEWETTKNLSEEFEIGVVAIRKYLKKGTKLGWCNYIPSEEAKKSQFKFKN